MTQLDQARGFDFHCHIDLDRDPAELIRRCEQERIVTLAVTTTPKAWPQNRTWATQSRFVYPALGLHPELVAERYDEIDILESYMPDARFVGEVGLDGSPRYRRTLSRQEEAFGRVLREAQRLGGRVLTIHSRGAAAEVVDMIEQNTTKDRVLCILHWFSGSPAIAKQAAAAGCFFSVNGQMLEHERGRALVKSLSAERLLTETDSPFTKSGSRPSAPWDVMQTAEELAVLRSLPKAEMSKTLAQNSRRVLAFAGLP
jgi:TatD DNase family protein